MKILEISSCFPPSRGGVEKCVYELSTRFAKSGHEVIVTTSTRGKNAKTHLEKLEDIIILRFAEKFHLFEAPLIPQIALTALTEDYDVLHVHGMCPSITDLSVLFAKMRGKPVVLTYHNDAESGEFRGLSKLAAFVYSSLASLIVRLSNVVVSSTMSYAETSAALRFSLDKIKVIPMGVDTRKYDAFDLSRNSNLERTLLFVGQLKYYKGVNVLLDAVHHLRSRGHLLKVNIVGEGPAFESLKEKAKALGVEEDVRFLGNVSDEELLQLYATCDSLVLPSLNRREAFGIVLLEAMAAGGSIVASDIPGVNEVALKGHGFLAKPNDPYSLANSILDSLQNRRRSDDMRRVAEDHSWDKLAEKYASIFEDITKNDVPNGGNHEQIALSK
ncbi:MAG: glycosyltransferase family 4 protein [Nitrososphaerota archaeon]|nr:glycosyltransferase family 4 protein [Nitrososphaerota archaeon]